MAVFTVVDGLAIGIKKSYEATDLVRIGIAQENITPPENPLAAHTGQGTVLVQWDKPCFGNPKRYEISASLDGAKWQVWSQGRISMLSAVLHGLPISINVRLRVRVISSGNTWSDYAPVKQGKLSNLQISIKATSIRGSIIKANAAFSVMSQDTQSLVAMKAPSNDTEIDGSIS